MWYVFFFFLLQGNLNKVKEIHDILRREKLPLSAQSFAALFECIGRLPADDASAYHVLKEYVEEMSQKVSSHLILTLRICMPHLQDHCHQASGQDDA
jgi:hypothetical protein